MGILRQIGTALALIAVTSLVIGGTGFSQVEANRSVEVAVVGDQNAFVGYATEDLSVRSGETVTLVEVTNRFPTPIDVVDVVVEGGEDVSVGLEPYPADIAPTESADLEASISCSRATESPMYVTLTVVGKGVKAELYGDTRSFEVRCVPGTQRWDGVRFSGNGNAKISLDNETVDAIVWGLEDESITEYGEVALDTDSAIRGQIEDSGDSTIVAVSVLSAGTTYVHPQYNASSTSLDSPANGGNGIPVDGVDYEDWAE